MDVYLVDGTYELFRHFFAVPSAQDAGGQEIGAVRGVLGSVLSILEKSSHYVGVATDHVIESFRNELYPYYKTGAGIEPKLYSQFPILEECLDAMGVKVWAMIEFEADDALAAAAAKAAGNPTVDKVVICTPDKDLAQCVVGSRVVQLDRRQNILRDESGVVEKFGVLPKAIPDYLALVGDSADGYPGLPGWGAKAAASVLAIYENLDLIPQDSNAWHPSIRSAKKLSATLRAQWSDAILFRTLATLREDVDVFTDLSELRWNGPKANFPAVCERLRAPELLKRTNDLLQKIG